jgi:hypothetical protein
MQQSATMTSQTMSVSTHSYGQLLPGYLVEVESLWLLVALDCQCIFRQALLYLQSNDAVESQDQVHQNGFIPMQQSATMTSQTMPVSTHSYGQQQGKFCC